MRILGGLIAIITLLAVTACAPREAKWTAEAASLAVYATQVPLYPGAMIEDSMGNESYGDDPESYSEGMVWWYNVRAPQEDIVSWYAAKLPNAKREVLEDGAVQFTLAPQGGEAGEDMGVIIENGKFRVFENTKAGKHKTV